MTGWQLAASYCFRCFGLFLIHVGLSRFICLVGYKGSPLYTHPKTTESSAERLFSFISEFLYRLCASEGRVSVVW